MTRSELAKLIDHTILRADAAQADIAALCDEAVQHGFAAVSINPAWVSFCAKKLNGSGVLVNATIGFPLGANTAAVKVAEARDAIKNGATELDMVINVGALKSGYGDFVEREIAALVKAAGEVPVKVILETSLLTEDEKVAVCEMAVRSGAAFVKTSTGFGRSGATTDDVALMRQIVGARVGVKASGGIRTYADAIAMVTAGANRLGTSSGIAILKEMPLD
ncbi:MAG TPA: deoxyribose-phosphate aldolase [Candidatus Hydrogenedentes bacterium]|nr:deoxyribose-phosphate aldolase [Candidatus Hydrogenedentota bacterium]